MDILAIESSCDETAAAVVRDGRTILSNVIHSQIEIHTEYGGVVPEIASRKHMEKIIPVVHRALLDAYGPETAAGDSAPALRDLLGKVDAVAVTAGPGLVGPLLVGVSCAKALAFAAGKPLIGVNHIEGHIAANYPAHPDLAPPYMGLVVSGGHTHLVIVEDYASFRILGRTVDDAAGEAFDKVARAVGLGYPGGPKIDRVSREGDPDAITFPKAKVNGAEYDFSFSGLKSCVLNYLTSEEMAGRAVNTADLAASFQKAVVDVLSDHLVHACREYGFTTAALAGGVSANSALRAVCEQKCKKAGIRLYVPPLILCTDNAAMIGAAAYYDLQRGKVSGWDLNAEPRLGLA